MCFKNYLIYKGVVIHMLNHLKNSFNETTTENGAFAYKSTKSDVLDLFSQGGAYRNRTDREVVQLFSKAFAENPLLAMKTLFYLRDVKGGQGERRFFRLALQHLAINNPEAVRNNLHLISEFGRWDDLWVLLDNQHLRNDIANLVKRQLIKDKKSENPSLLAKWMPSENASSKTTKKYARILREHYGVEPKQYRKLLSELRSRIGLVETKLTEKNYSAIEYDKLPSKAGMIYRGAFFRNDQDRYQDFLDALSNGTKKVNSSTLYPYEITSKAMNSWGLGHNDVQLLDGQWRNLPDYIGEREENSIAVVDVSGSMTGRPMEVAISIGLYLAERNKGALHNHFFTFSERPQLVTVKGTNIVEKVQNMRRADWGYSTNVASVFEKLLQVAVQNNVAKEEMIDKLYIISDMQFNQADGRVNVHLFKALERQYAKHGYKLPQLVFWNVDARVDNTPFTMNDFGVQIVSGFSPSIFTTLMSGEVTTPYDLMLEVINSERYAEVTV
jgi:hypothetical protein